MKIKIAVCVACLSVSAWAQAPDARLTPPPSPASAVAPGVDGGEPRQALRLRESLRLPKMEQDPANKPYRLSAEERQRLREQLRNQTALMETDR